jgi:hypothetical protein
MKRQHTAKEKEIEDANRLLRAWKNFHAEEKAAVLAGPYAVTRAELFRMFANLKHVQPAQLIGFIGAIDWAAIDYQTRLVVLHEINAAITRFREANGQESIDDALWHEPPRAFQLIRGIVMNQFPASAERPAEPIRSESNRSRK